MAWLAIGLPGLMLAATAAGGLDLLPQPPLLRSDGSLLRNAKWAIAASVVYGPILVLAVDWAWRSARRFVEIDRLDP